MSTRRENNVSSLPLITYSLLLFFLSKPETTWSVEPDDKESITSDRRSGISVDVPTMAILMVYVRYEYEGKLKEDFFFYVTLPRRTTGAEILKTIIDFIENKGSDMKNCVGICSDGAASMIGKKSGVITRIKQLAPKCAPTHCFIHRESLATKKLSTKFNDVLCEVVKIAYFIKGSAVISRLFAF